VRVGFDAEKLRNVLVAGRQELGGRRPAAAPDHHTRATSSSDRHSRNTPCPTMRGANRMTFIDVFPRRFKKKTRFQAAPAT